ncbi:MAG: hypothetical protein AAF563_13730 [Pseudomonadota bacterium]
MEGLNQTAQKFLRSYEQQYRQFQAEAELARGFIKEVTRGSSALVHTIAARAKTPESVLRKIRRKHYSDPDKQVTDLIGVRVITFYSDDVDAIAARLQDNLDINLPESIDKRVQLGLREFGYRSVQLIARLKPAHPSTEDFKVLKGRWFEIQVRSILEHAWAEIEHEVVYKSGVRFPEEVVRRFASLAGTLELLDSEFLALRQERDDLIDGYRHAYTKHGDDRRAFDVARLLGYLEAARPKGLSWRQAEEAGTPFHAGLDSSCVDALKAVGLGTARSLSDVFKSRRFRYAASSFAASQGIAPKSVSHVAAVVLALVVTDANVIRRHFPDVVFDSAIEEMIERRLAKRSG